ncbi:ABC transporter permease [Nonomuraea guangzhouensis]|uniref:Transport permease protein n=1 Tax=Nonomuraea guangzhouensis TaxID=1291555 RepID=A0ABW4GVH0_9ACTN|nr:ABC transporter permease [Nonomuraea guangzhouensis]
MSRSLKDAFRDAAVMARRNLVQIKGEPGLLLDATITPVVISVIFVAVFGAAIAGNVTNYAQYFIPGIMAINLMIISRTTGVGMSVDFNSGVVDRFRSLPISRSAVLSGRVIADSLRMLLSLVVIIGCSTLIGFRLLGGMAGTLGAVALLMGFGIAMSWIAVFIGVSVRSITTVSTVTSLWVLPFQFGSSAFVPTDGMPAWLRVFADLNPITLVVDASRGLLDGHASPQSIAGAIAWITAILVVFAPLSVARFYRRA